MYDVLEGKKRERKKRKEEKQEEEFPKSGIFPVSSKLLPPRELYITSHATLSFSNWLQGCELRPMLCCKQYSQA